MIKATARGLKKRVFGMLLAAVWIFGLQMLSFFCLDLENRIATPVSRESDASILMEKTTAVHAEQAHVETSCLSMVNRHLYSAGKEAGKRSCIIRLFLLAALFGVSGSFCACRSVWRGTVCDAVRTEQKIITYIHKFDGKKKILPDF